MHGTYDPALVTFSVAIGILAAYTALDIAGRVAAVRGAVRAAWLTGGALAMGTGIWTMHFVGMLAFRLPVPMAYSVPLVALSWFAAVAAAGGVLAATYRRRRARVVVAAGVAIGAAICAMHYIGMASLRIPVGRSYDLPLVAASVVVALGAAAASIWLFFLLRTGQERGRSWGRRAGAAVVLGVAIAGMHYIGMAAARFGPGGSSMLVAETSLLATTGLAVSVIVGTLVILGIALLCVVIDRRMRSASAEASVLRERARLAAERAAILGQMTDGVVIADPEGRVTFVNEAARRIHGASHEGLSIEDYARAIGLLTPAGEPFPVETLPLARAVRYGERLTNVEVHLPGHDGAAVILSVGASPVVAQDGSRIGGVLVLRDVTRERMIASERATLLQRADSALVAAEAASVAKSNFLATMSHELRTPLNAILGYAELLEMQIAGPLNAQQSAYLERTRESGRHLLGLINEVLDLARIESGRLSISTTQGNISRPLEAAITFARPAAAARSVAIDASCASERGASYIGDENRVRQILVNLLANAVKFTSPGGRVAVTCELVDAHDPEAPALGGARLLRVRVSDTGIGIPRELQEKVFEPFVQAEGGPTRTKSGTGLGLTISRQLARLMGGDITLKSEPGVGSTFTLWLRAATSADVPAAPGAGSPAHNGALAGPAEIGETLTSGTIEGVVRAIVARLRIDPQTPAARGAPDAVVEDHLGTLLREVAQTLAFTGPSGVLAEDFLEDGSAIRRAITERHGAQRFRYGWTEPAIHREYEIVRQEIEAAVLRDAPPHSEEAVSRVFLLVARYLRRAEEASLHGFRLAESVGVESGS